MFERALIQERLDTTASFPHSAAVLSPYAFEIRAAGFGRGVPSFRVHVERSAFRLRASVMTDYLAVAIVAAVTNGVRNNPARLNALAKCIHDLGWQPDLAIDDENFRVEATQSDIAGLSEMDLNDPAADVAIALSEFVLDQLLITRPAGEVRPAVPRSLGETEPAEVWLYDPSERDRSTQVHRSLENWLMAKLEENGLQALDAAGPPFFDLAWRTRASGQFCICEVKSTANNEDHQVRLAVGQVLQYRQALRRTHPNVTASILVERAPDDPVWDEICGELGVVLFWPERWNDVASVMTGQ